MMDEEDYSGLDDDNDSISAEEGDIDPLEDWGKGGIDAASTDENIHGEAGNT